MPVKDSNYFPLFCWNLWISQILAKTTCSRFYRFCIVNKIKNKNKSNDRFPMRYGSISHWECYESNKLKFDVFSIIERNINAFTSLDLKYAQMQMRQPMEFIALFEWTESVWTNYYYYKRFFFSSSKFLLFRFILIICFARQRLMSCRFLCFFLFRYTFFPPRAIFIENEKEKKNSNTSQMLFWRVNHIVI